MTTTATGDVSSAWDDNPNTATDWSNVQGLFDFYRVNAMKVTFIPTNTADTFLIMLLVIIVMILIKLHLLLLLLLS
jgi:hypothetical protein